MDGEDFARAVSALSEATEVEYVNAILEFAAKCFTGFNEQKRSRLGQAAQGRLHVRSTADAPQIAALKAVHEAQDLTPIPDALTALANMTGVRVTRPELYHEVDSKLEKVQPLSRVPPPLLAGVPLSSCWDTRCPVYATYRIECSTCSQAS